MNWLNCWKFISPWDPHWVKKRWMPNLSVCSGVIYGSRLMIWYKALEFASLQDTKETYQLKPLMKSQSNYSLKQD